MAGEGNDHGEHCDLWKRGIQANIPNCEVPVPSVLAFLHLLCLTTTWMLFLGESAFHEHGKVQEGAESFPWFGISSIGSSLLHKPGLEEESSLEAPNLSWSSRVIRDQMILEGAFDSLPACSHFQPSLWELAAERKLILTFRPLLGTRDLSCRLDIGNSDETQEGRQGEGKEISFFLQTWELYWCLEICQNQWNNLGNHWKICCGGSAVL